MEAIAICKVNGMRLAQTYPDRLASYWCTERLAEKIRADFKVTVWEKGDEGNPRDGMLCITNSSKWSLTMLFCVWYFIDDSIDCTK